MEKVAEVGSIAPETDKRMASVKENARRARELKSAQLKKKRKWLLIDIFLQLIFWLILSVLFKERLAKIGVEDILGWYILGFLCLACMLTTIILFAYRKEMMYGSEEWAAGLRLQMFFYITLGLIFILVFHNIFVLWLKLGKLGWAIISFVAGAVVLLWREQYCLLYKQY